MCRSCPQDQVLDLGRANPPLKSPAVNRSGWPHQNKLRLAIFVQALGSVTFDPSSMNPVVAAIWVDPDTGLKLAQVAFLSKPRFNGFYRRVPPASYSAQATPVGPGRSGDHHILASSRYCRPYECRMIRRGGSLDIPPRCCCWTPAASALPSPRNTRCGPPTAVR